LVHFYLHFFFSRIIALPQQEETGYARVILQIMLFAFCNRKVALSRGVFFSSWFSDPSNPLAAILSENGDRPNDRIGAPVREPKKKKKKKKTPLPASPARGTFGVA
jgi:hypothetical protein